MLHITQIPRLYNILIFLELYSPGALCPFFESTKWYSGKESACNTGDMGLNPGL